MSARTHRALACVELWMLLPTGGSSVFDGLADAVLANVRAFHDYCCQHGSATCGSTQISQEQAFRLCKVINSAGRSVDAKPTREGWSLVCGRRHSLTNTGGCLSFLKP